MSKKQPPEDDAAPSWNWEADEKTDYKKRIEGMFRGTKYFEFIQKDKVPNAMLPWLRIFEVVEAQKTSETTSRIVFRFPVQREFLNPGMTLHGGLSAGIYDAATTALLELIRKPGFWMRFGMSRSLNVTFIRPAVEGEMLLMDCETVHVGKRLCMLKAVLKREKDGAIISTCEHQKYNIDADLAKA